MCGFFVNKKIVLILIQTLNLYMPNKRLISLLEFVKYFFAKRLNVYLIVISFLLFMDGYIDDKSHWVNVIIALKKSFFSTATCWMAIIFYEWVNYSKKIACK